MSIRRFSRMRLRMVALAWVIAESFSGSTALAQLDGGVVAAGAATISQQGSVTNIMQTTDRAVINWNNFSVPQGHTANFNMPSVNSAVLNRVTSLNNPSLINGAINSNGNVFLVNPSGVIIGSTGVINTAGFTASALDLPNSEFMQGGNLHFRGDSKASIINNGKINTGAGGVALVGHTVINTGTITSQGSISLVSGGSVKLSNGGTYTQADLATINNGISETAGLIKNTGTIRAVGSVNSGGEVYLVNPNGKILHSGVIRATRATTVAAAPSAPTTTKVAGGKVQIEARNSAAEISGTVDVSGDVGGKVSITGSAVQLASATIDASGTNGGGVVQLGGGFQGKDTSITNALATSVDAASTISVNARTGNAGTVIVWSDQATDMAGTITAQSTVSGDGGFVEVSGKQGYSYTGLVMLGAANGMGGTLLIDPPTFTIDATNVASLRTTWGSGGTLNFTADNTITLNADLFPTTAGGTEILAGVNGNVNFSDSTDIGDAVDIIINATIRNGNNSNYAGQISFNAGSGLFQITSSGKVEMSYGFIYVTAGTIDLAGQLNPSFYPIYLTAYNGASIGLGTNAAGTFHLFDSEIDLISSGSNPVYFSGGAIDVKMSSSHRFNRPVQLSGTSTALQGFYGQNLSINSPTLTISGPINGSGSSSFSYVQGGSRSLGLGNPLSGNPVVGDVKITHANVNQLTGFSYVSFGTQSSNSPLVADNIDLSAFQTVELRGSTVTMKDLKIQSSLTLGTNAFTVLNPLQKTNNNGSLNLYFSASGDVTLGPSSGSGLIISQATLNSLGQFSSGNLQVSTSGKIDVDVDLTTFSNGVYLSANTLNIQRMDMTGSTQLYASVFNITGNITDTTPGSTLTFGIYNGFTNQQLYLGNGAGSATDWKIDSTELGFISGFGSLYVYGHGSSTLNVNADLRSSLTSSGYVYLQSNEIVVQSLKVPASLAFYTNAISIQGDVESFNASSYMQLQPYNSSNSIGLGDTATGIVHLNQAELNRLKGFDSLQLSSSGPVNIVGAALPMSLYISNGSSSDTTINGLTFANPNSYLQIYSRNIYGTGIQVGGSVTISAQSAIRGLTVGTRFGIDRLNSTASASFNSSSTAGDIALSISNAGTGQVSSSNSNGSIDIAAIGSIRLSSINASNPTGTVQVPITPTATVMLSSTNNGDIILLSQVSSVTSIAINSAGAIVDNYSGSAAPLAAPGTIQLTAVGNIQNNSGSYFDVVSNSTINATTTGLDSNIRLQASGTLKLGTITTNSGIVYARAYGGSNRVLDALGIITTGGAELLSTGTLNVKTLNATENVLLSASDDITVRANTITITGGGNTTLRSMGDIHLLGGVQNSSAAGGSVNLIAGWDGSTLGADAWDMTPFLAANVNTTTIYGRNNGSIFIGDGTQTAGIAVGSRNGATNAFGYDLKLTASSTSEDFAQLGFNVRNQGASYNVTGAITAHVKNDITALAGNASYSYAQIGHLGSDLTEEATIDATVNAPITIAAGGKLTFTSGNQYSSYAQLGHGGTVTRGPLSGAITITKAGDLNFIASAGQSAYVQLGHGGYNAGEANLAGDILLQDVGNVIFTAGSNQGAYAQLGHGGYGTRAASGGGHNGNIFINANGDIRFSGGSSYYAYAQLGHGGFYAVGNHGGLGTGDIKLNFNALVFQAQTGENIYNPYAYVQLGHGGYDADGNHAGNITLTGNGVDPITFQAGGDQVTSAQLGHGGYSANGSYAGDIEISNTGGINFLTTSNQNYNYHFSSYAQLGHGGTYSLGSYYDPQTDQIIPHMAQGRILVHDIAGDLNFGPAAMSGQQNSSYYNQANYVQLGHGGFESNGKLNGHIRIDRVGNLNFSTYDSNNSSYNYDYYNTAQLGHGGHGFDGDIVGNIQIDSVAGVNFTVKPGVNNTYNYYALHNSVQLGHGGTYSSGTILGGISLTNVANDIRFEMTGTHVYYSSAQLGHGGHGSYQSSRNGAITIQGLGDGQQSIFLSQAANPQGNYGYNTVQIGHGGYNASGGNSSAGNLGNITISDVENLTINNASTGYESAILIGHGGLYASGSQANDIEITLAGNLNMQGSATGYDNIARIGHHADNYGAASGNISISVGASANLTRSSIGHLAYSGVSGNTFIGVGQNAPQTPGSGTLTADANSSFSSGPTGFGQLRFYIPSRNDYQIAAGAQLNGTAAQAPGTSPLYNEQSFATFGNGTYNITEAGTNYAYYFGQIRILVTALGSSTYGTAPDPLQIQYALADGYMLRDGDTLAGIITGNNLASQVDAMTGVGDYGFTFSVNSNYQLEIGSEGTWTVNPAPLDITFSSINKQYGTAVNVNLLTTVQGIYFNDAYTLNYTNTGAAANAQVNGGTAHLTTGSITHTSNYYIRTENLGTITVTPAPLTITARNRNKVYGDPNYTLGTSQYTTQGLLFSSDKVTSVTLSSSGESRYADVGNYAITPSAAVGTRLDNYTISYKDGNLRVNPAALLVGANLQVKEYGETFTFNGTEFYSVGLKNNEQITSATLSSNGANRYADASLVPYKINISNAVGTLDANGHGFKPSNYNIVYVPGAMFVTPAPLLITIRDQQKEYGEGFVFNGTEFDTTPLKNNDTLTTVTLASAGQAAAADVGNYAINASLPVTGSIKLSNYKITVEPGTLKVTPAPLTLTANNQYKTYSWTGFLNGVTGFTPTGLKLGQTIGSVSLSSAATPNTAPIGFYPINISDPTGGTANLANYSITLVPGIFVVGSNFGNFYYDLNDQGQYYWQTLPSLYGNSSGGSNGLNYSPAGQTTGDKPITGTNSYDVFGGEQ